MIIKDIIEDTLARKSTSSCELSILIGVDSFDYTVQDSQRQVLALRSYRLKPGPLPAAVEAIFQSDKFLHQPFARIRLGAAGGKNTLIPERLYQESEKEAYLRQTTEIGAENIVRSDALSALGLRNVYALPQALEAFARHAFPAGRMYHAATALLHGLRPFAGQGTAVFAHLLSNQLCLAVFDRGNLAYSNTFSFKTAKDFIYCVLLVFQQLGLDPGEQKLFFSGSLLQESEIFKEAWRYVRQVEFLEAPTGFQFGPRLGQEPAYLHFGLLSLSLL